MDGWWVQFRGKTIHDKSNNIYGDEHDADTNTRDIGNVRVQSVCGSNYCMSWQEEERFSTFKENLVY